MTFFPLKMPIFFILMLLTGGISAGRPPECEWFVQKSAVTAGGDEGYRAVCHLRTLTPDMLNSDGNRTLKAIDHASRITVLTLKCAHQVVFLSELRPSMFNAFSRLEDLTILNCKLTKLPNHAMAGLSHLRRLSIRAHHEDWPGASLELGDYALSDLSRLEELNLSYNNVWVLPIGTLCHLPSLVSLNLTHNSLHHLADLGLSSTGGCSHPLLHLWIDFNEIDEVRERVLEGARDLRILSLSNNHLARLSDFAFKGLEELRHLNLSKNKLVAIPRTAFSDLRQLRDLNLANNSIGNLPARVFENLEHLLTLNLSRNNIDLPPGNEGPFFGLIRLVILDLSYNKMTYIERESFKDLYSLQILHLNHNHITHLQDYTFSGLSNLYNLELSFNNLEEISSKTFRGLSVLAFLQMSNNKLNFINDYALQNCSSIQQLDIGFNELTNIPKAISLVKLIRVLHINNNKLINLNPKSLEGLIHLEELRLNHNYLESLSREPLTKLPSLKILDVSYNSIPNIENGTLSVIPLLQGLNISNNLLANLLEVVPSSKNLLWLNASHNNLEWFDYALVHPNLLWLDISHNNINTLGNHFKFQEELKLQVIYASYNNISEISGYSLPNKIKNVYLQNNKLSFVASNTFKDKHLISVIDLSYNELTILQEASIRLPPKTIISPTFHPVLYLTGNQLECDCGGEWLLRAITGAGTTGHVGSSLLPRLGDVTNIKCKLPGIWENIVAPIVNVQPQQFLCTYRRHCFSVCHCCDFDACDCEQNCPNNCTCYHDHTWAHHIVDCGKGTWSQLPSGVPMDVTEAFMDGNNMGSLTSHSLIGRQKLKNLYLNHSLITNIENRTFNGLKKLLVLRLDHNLLRSLHGYEFVHLHNLLELHLNHNNLNFLGNITFTPLRSLELLKLDNNQLAVFPVWNLALNPFLIEVSLYGNPWSCECNFLANLRAWLEANRIKTVNGSQIKCYHNISKELGPPILSDSPVTCDHYVGANNINQLIANDYVMLVTISIALLILLIVGALIAVTYRRRLKLWAVTRYGKRLFEKSSSYVEEREKLFDAFISHSVKDAAWVCGLLAPELESRGYRLCVAHRDCTIQTTSLTGQAITESISCSRRVIMVISKRFVDCEWCRYEFKSAHLEGLRMFKRKHLIVIVLEDLPRSEFDTELNSIVCSTSPPLNPGDPRFWERLRRALPSLRHKKRLRHVNNLNKAVSKPLVSIEQQTGTAWQLPESKSVGRVSTNSLIVNPYWETAVTAVPDGSWTLNDVSKLEKSPWIANPLRDCSSPLLNGNRKELDHTYMTMSECGDIPPSVTSGTTLSTVIGPSSSNGDNQHSRSFYQDAKNKNDIPCHHSSLNAFFRRDGPDYITRSWIFHPPPETNPPPPGQTYFV